MATETPAIELNPYSHEFHEDPYAVYATLREHAPLYYNEDLDFYAVTRHEDVAAVLRDNETYLSGYGTVLELMGADYGEVMAGNPMILFMDPPDHTKLRRLVSLAFTPRAIARLEDHIRSHTAELCDRLAAAGGGDFVDSFAAPLPMHVIFEMLGVPSEDRPQVREWIDRMLDRIPEPPYIPDYAMEAALHNSEYNQDLIAEHRKHPQDNLIGDLLAAEITEEDGERRQLSDGEILGFIGLLGGAGNETITKLLTNTLVLLQRHPDARRRAVEDPTALKNAVEESLRFWAPAQYNGRTTSREVTLHGETIPEGSTVVAFMASANRDERRFPDAEVFDIDRSGKESHLSFGVGIHFCLGAALARTQARIGLEMFLERFPDYEIDEAGLERVHSSNVHGFEHAPITVRPR